MELLITDLETNKKETGLREKNREFSFGHDKSERPIRKSNTRNYHTTWNILGPGGKLID